MVAVPRIEPGRIGLQLGPVFGAMAHSDQERKVLGQVLVDELLGLAPLERGAGGLHRLGKKWNAEAAVPRHRWKPVVSSSVK
ncbi:MAG: hypothetical protein GY719_37890 [bacterium]|nr:hypothetical protein [bacterium]